MQGTNNSEKCGQSIVFGIHELYDNLTNNLKKDEKGNDDKNDDDFSLSGYSTDTVWRYRRLIGKGLLPKQGELTLQNWNGPGNDYRDGYLFLSQN